MQLFQALPDPRVVQRCDHELSDVLVIALCCLLCGGETFNDMEESGHAKQAWFKTFLALRNGTPRHDTSTRWHKPRPKLEFVETVEKDHGRLEIRRYWLSAELDWFADREQWAGLRTVGLVESVRQEGAAAPTTERRYYLNTLGPGVARFAGAVRGHWGVENQVHWALDVQMNEDQSRARTGEPGHPTPAGAQPPAPLPDQAARHQRQTALRRLEPWLPPAFAQPLMRLP